MMLAAIVWGAPAWLLPALIIAAVLAALLAWGYYRAPSSTTVRAVAAGLKAFGILILLACLLEPLLSGVRAIPGANLFVVLADSSQSLALRHDGAVRAWGGLEHASHDRKALPGS